MRLEALTTTACLLWHRSVEDQPRCSSEPDSLGIMAGSSPGGTLVILEMPKGAEFGIDMKIYSVGEKFRGICDIPLGLHFVTFGTGAGLRQGFFMKITSPGQVIVKSWDPANEEFVEKGTGLPEGSMTNLLEALKRGALTPNLGPYPEEQAALWRNLSNAITDSVLRHCGLELETRVLPGDWDEEVLEAQQKQQREGGAVVPFFAEAGRTARFVDMLTDRRGAESGLQAQELTQYNLDQSARLGRLLSSAYQGDWKLLLGEFQLAFMMFLSIYSMSGLKHWKEVVACLCGCQEALRDRSELFVAFVRVLFTQVKMISEDFFEDEISKEAFLKPAFVSLVRNVREEWGVSDELREHVDRFARLMEKRFKGLSFDQEIEAVEEDEAPTVVPLDEIERIMQQASLEDTSL